MPSSRVSAKRRPVPASTRGRVVEPFVEALLVLRTRARDARDWTTADLIRDRLIAAGVEVRDDADSSTWILGTPPAD